MIDNYKDLDVWRKSVALTTERYRLTSGFPDTERYGLTSQIRRAIDSQSPPTSQKDGEEGQLENMIQFLTVSRGSLMELETHLIVAMQSVLSKVRRA